METIRDIFVDAIKLAGELLKQDTPLDAGQLDAQKQPPEALFKKRRS